MRMRPALKYPIISRLTAIPNVAFSPPTATPTSKVSALVSLSLHPAKHI